MDGEILSVILNVSVLAFVITSMLAMGFSLTIPQVVEPLRNVRLVVFALAVNFVLVPLVAWGASEVLSLRDGYEVGLIIMATAAGAPFLPKLAQAAKGNVAFSVGLMVLLMMVTIIYMPLVLPLLLSGVEVDALAIASSLFWTMLVPLAIGLFFRARYPGVAATLHPQMSRASSMSLVLLLVAGLAVNFTDILDTFGTGAIVVVVGFLLVALGAGYFAGGSDPAVRSVLGLGTAQRNLSAALIVAAQNFSDDPDVIVFIMVAAILGLVLLMAAAGEFGRRADQEATTSAG
jgi:BASS family bile acid:Na+ symporter